MTATDPFDADRLDAWLEGNPFPTASLNGHSDTQPDLVGTAQRFHADAGNAERGLPVPTRAIWEDVMQRTAGLQISPPTIPTTAGDEGHRPPPVVPRRPVAGEPPHQRGLWITTVSLIVVAMFAIAAVAYLANRSNENLSGTTNTPETPNLAANFSSSPVAASFEIISPDQIDCGTIERRSNDEISALQSDPGEFPDRSYGPSLAASEQDAQAIAEIDPYVSMCHSEWRSLASPRLIADAQATGYPYGLFPDFYLDQGMTRESLVALLQDLVAESGVTTAAEILIPTDAPDTEDSWYAVINPDHVRLFPDGRLGALQTWVIPASFGADQEAYQTNYVFYIQDPTQDGKWVLDETLPVCVGECDEYWAQMIEGSWNEELPNPISTATPAASPVAVDESEWLIDPEKIVCNREFGNWQGTRSTEIPGTINDYIPFEVAPNQTQMEVARTNQAVAGLCFDELGQEAYFASALWNFPLPTAGIPVTQAQLDIARSISEVINTGDAMDFVHATAAPFELIQPVVSHSALLPSSVVELPDGRYAAPLHIVVEANSPEELRLSVDESGGIVVSSLVIYTPVADGYVMEGYLPICLGDCDGYWDTYEISDATESPVATPEASPEADDGITLDPEATYVDPGFWLLPEYPGTPEISGPDGSALLPAVPPTTETPEPSTELDGSPVEASDIDRWLVPSSQLDCATPAPGDPNAINSLDWPIDQVVDVNAYLPFGTPATDQQTSIADTALLVFSDCVNSTMLSPDFAWIFGMVGQQPSQEQIAAAQEVSASLFDQNPDNYFIVGSSSDPDYRGRTVLLPDDVVMLSDGRLGAPTRLFFTSQGDANWISSQMGDGAFAMTFFYTFENSGDGWLLDEMFPVCVGECDEFWQSAANRTNLDGTPEPLTNSPATYDAITADDCTAQEADLTGPFNAPRPSVGNNPYVASGLPRVDLLGDVADSVRGWHGCILADDGTSPEAFQTTAFTDNGGTTRDPWFGDIADPVERASRATGFQLIYGDLAEEMLSGTWDDFNVSVEYANSDYDGLAPMGNRAVVLADARIAVPLMTIWPQSAANDAGDDPYWFVPVDVLIWSIEADRWLVDESLQLCAGDCDQFMLDINTFEPGATTEPGASPAASDIERWLVPPSEIDCGTPEVGDGNSTERSTDLQIDTGSYLPFSPPTSLTQQEVAATATFNMFSCGEPWPLSDDFAWMPGPSVVIPTDEQISAAQEISAALPDQDPASYLIARNTENAPDEAWPVILPDDVMTLADGRVGAVARWVVPSDEVAASMAEQTDNGSYMWSAFFTFEQAGDDWLLDEMILICIGECDGWWEMMVAPSMLPATPEASVVAEATPQPITAEECDVDGLSSNEVSAIVADQGEEPERSYVPVGPANSVDAVLAAQADRAWVACSTYGSIGQRTALQTPWLTATGPETDLLTDSMDETITRINQRQPLSDGMLSTDQLDYYVSSGQTEDEMNAGLMGYSTTVPHPNDAFVLEDGRIAIPQMIVMPSDSYMFTEEWEPYGPYYSIPVHILAKDPETQRWLVDEVIWLAGGDLDELILSLRDQEAAMLEQAGMSPATPEATPAGDS